MSMGNDTFSSQVMRGYRLTISLQLRKAAEMMHHPGELFQWLASVIVQRFDVPVVQLWACEHTWSGQSVAQSWAMACQNPFQLPYAVSERVGTIVEHMARGQPTPSAQPLEQVFPQYLATLLKRYGLSYCAYSLIDGTVHFVSENSASLHERTSMKLTFIPLLFLQHYPDKELISSTSFLMEQAIALAENHHLLLSGASSSDSLPALQEANSQELPTVLAGVVPRLKQDAGLFLSSNPFASSATIADKQALRLYEAIDGNKTVAELCTSARMSLNEAIVALQTLLSLRRIELYTQDGWPIDAAQLFDGR